jgi:hypothetical protein
MAAGERLSLEGYFTSLYEEEDSDESDEEYMPRDVWKRVSLRNTYIVMHLYSFIQIYMYACALTNTHHHHLHMYINILWPTINFVCKDGKGSTTSNVQLY